MAKRKVIRTSKSFEKKVLDDNKLKIVTDLELSKNFLPYMIFAFDFFNREKGIDYKEILILIYLNELVYFRLGVEVFGLRVGFGYFLEKGFIKESHFKKSDRIYILTDYAKNIVNDFYSKLADVDSFKNENRIVDVINTDMVSVVLNKYIKKATK